MTVFVNGYFRGQPVTGQQRFAHEVANRLVAQHGALELGPRSPRRGRVRDWAAVQARVPLIARGGVVISLTARAPFLARKQIVTIHDLFPLTNPEWFSPLYLSVHTRLLARHLRAADGIVAVSEPVRAQVLERARPGMPVVVAPNAPTTALAAATGASEAPAGCFLAVGSIEPRKNLNRLVEAHRSLPNALRAAHPLVVVGGSADIFRDGFTAARQEHVHFSGRVSDGELAALYRGCAAFVSVSLGEGFGLPVVEAAAAGVPRLVLSDIAVYRWLANATNAVYVDPLSVESIAAGLAGAVGRSPDRSLAELASRFSWEATAAEIASFAAQF